MSDTSPLAFPLQGQDAPVSYGMLLRDWFAGQALAGIASAMKAERFDLILSGVQAGGLEAHVAYCLADAMLKEREK